MKLNLLFILTSFLTFNLSGIAQVSKNSSVNINMLGVDSARVNSKSSYALLTLNYQTGETVLKVKAETFSTEDSMMKKVFFQKINEIELHFNITRAMMDLMKSDNKEHSSEAPGMLYINNHFQSVTINYSIYNKNGNAIDFANNNVLLSIQCNFSPKDYQLDDISEISKEPMLIWMNKQTVNFLHTD
jgi:hypothetical protein